MDSYNNSIPFLICAVLFMLFCGIFYESEKLEIKLKQYEPYELVWATRYSKTLPSKSKCGNCISVEDTAREGFYYDTKDEATMKGHQAMINDSLEGYKVYFETLEVYPTLKSK